MRFLLQKGLAFHYISNGIRLLGPFQQALFGRVVYRFSMNLGAQMRKMGTFILQLIILQRKVTVIETTHLTI